MRGNPGIRHRAHRCRDVFTALLAADREIALPSLRKVEHECQYRRTKGEYSPLIRAFEDRSQVTRKIQSNSFHLVYRRKVPAGGRIFDPTVMGRMSIADSADEDSREA